MTREPGVDDETGRRTSVQRRERTRLAFETRRRERTKRVGLERYRDGGRRGRDESCRTGQGELYLDLFEKPSGGAGGGRDSLRLHSETIHFSSSTSGVWRPSARLSHAMPDSSGDDNDSRTAAVGLQRPRSANGPASQNRGKRHGERLGRRDVRDFVPQGGTFSSTALEVDPDSTSSSASDSSSDEDESAAEDAKIQQPLGAVPPAINWNRGSKTAIRTTLSGRSRTGQNAATSSFESVNGKYWRSRSASVSTSDDDQDARDVSGKSDSEEGQQVKAVDSAPNGQQHYLDISDESDSGEVSGSEEGDSTIMLNIGSRNDPVVIDETTDGAPLKEGLFPSNTPPPLDPGRINGAADERTVSNVQNASADVVSQPSGTSSPRPSKEDAFRAFCRKYATPPSILADLDSKDLEVQARHFFYNRSIHDIDLTLPIACTECLQEGHLAEVCPSKEVRFSYVRLSLRAYPNSPVVY